MITFKEKRQRRKDSIVSEIDVEVPKRVFVR